MDFPLFFLDHIGNRLLIAVVAILHVLINHPFAVGGYPILVFIEWLGMRRNDRTIDEVARKITFVFFIVTTTVGAITGVGIWLVTGLISPFAIGSLLRVFFFAWAFEWIIFIIEIGLILAYFLLWEKWREGRKKQLHLRLGILLSIFSWITMAIITGILGFMMDPGNWQAMEPVGPKNFFSAMFNPIYLPQLAFRTTYALVTGGLLVWALLACFTPKKSDIRADLIQRIALFILVCLPLAYLSIIWYWQVVPGFMKANFDAAVLGAKFAKWHGAFLWIALGVMGSFLLSALWGALRPRKFPTLLLVVPFFFSLWILGHFERIREFIRKPYIIAGYMYANGIRETELPILQRDGMLTHATFVKHRQVTETNKVEAGQDVFMIACSRCHTTTGINGVINQFEDLYRAEEWNDEDMKIFMDQMHNALAYKPPFPGNDAEKMALIAYLKHLRENPQTVPGAQTEGPRLPPSPVEVTP